MRYLIVLVSLFLASAANADLIEDSTNELRDELIASTCFLTATYSDEEILAMEWPALTYIKNQCEKEEEISLVVLCLTLEDATGKYCPIPELQRDAQLLFPINLD